MPSEWTSASSISAPMKEDSLSHDNKLLIISVMAVSMLIGSIIHRMANTSASDMRKQMQQEAVDNNCGHWTVDDKGAPKFNWGAAP